jgi:hypothetical protein
MESSSQGEYYRIVDGLDYSCREQDSELLILQRLGHGTYSQRHKPESLVVRIHRPDSDSIRSLRVQVQRAAWLGSDPDARFPRLSFSGGKQDASNGDQVIAKSG